MARVRDILRRVRVEVAVGTRRCHRCRKAHSIAKDTAHLAVREEGYNNRKNYCREAARPILDLAARRLADMRTELGL